MDIRMILCKNPVLDGKELKSHCVGLIPYYTKMMHNKITVTDRTITRRLLDN